MKKKHLVTIFCVVVGGSGATAVGLWPQYAAAIQMTIYTSMVFGSLFLGLWSERHRPAFWVGILLALPTHGLILYAIRSTFPFRSILIVVPIALTEAVAMLAAFLKILGDDGAE